MGVCNYFMFCCTLLYVHSRFAIFLMGKRELVALLGLSSWFLVTVVWLFFAGPWGFRQFVIVVFPNHSNLLFLTYYRISFGVSDINILKVSMNNFLILKANIVYLRQSIKCGKPTAEDFVIRKSIYSCI